MAEETNLFHGRVGGGNQWIWLQKNSEQTSKIVDKLTEKELKNVKIREAAVEESETRLKKFKENADQEAYEKEKALLKRLKKEKEDAEWDLIKAKKAVREQAARTAEIFEQNSYKKMSAAKRRTYQQDVKKELELKKKSLEDQAAIEAAEIQRNKNILRSKTATDEEKSAARSAIEDLSKNKDKNQAAIDDVSADLSRVLQLINQVSTAAEKAAVAGEQAKSSRNEADHARAELTNWEADNLKKLRAARKAGDKETQKALEEEWAKKREIADAAEKQATEDEKRLKKADKAAKKEEERQKRKDEAEKKRQELVDRFTNVNAMSKKIEENLNTVFGQRAKMMARLQGSTEDWGEAVNDVSNAIGFSGLVDKKNVITKMADLVDKGVAYNVELRAFLQETSQNIASTFDAFDANLLRIIRLQQADTTAARLGMEATLTKMFNTMFSDTSYLSDASDSVTQALIGASATMDKNESLAFEYDVQKWLGALYSLGMSSSATQTIAEGLGYIATGNVSALNNNSALQTLFAMSASRSGGKSYADMLLGGLTSQDTNTLLRSMVEYLAEIAESQENNVTKSAYAELFGMSVTDLSTFASLTQNEIQQLYDNTADYSSLVTETSNQLNQIYNRLSLSQIVDNVINNAELGIATTIGSNAFTYGTWKALGLLSDYVGEIPIPGILAAGFGISSDIDLLNVAKTAMVGFGAVGSLLGALGSMANGGPSNLAAWDFKEYTSRGATLALLPPGTAGKSYSAQIGVGNASGSDVESVSMQSAQDKAYESGQTSEEEIEAGKEIPEKIYNALAGGPKPTVLSLLQEINTKLAPGRVFYTAIAGVMSDSAVNKITNLSSKLDVRKNTSWVSSTTTNGTNGGNNGDNGTPRNSNSQDDTGIGQGSDTLGADTTNKEVLIDAIEQAIRNVCGYTNGEGLPVTVTNFNTITLL